MIFGIGVDIVHIPRIQAALERFGQPFAARLLSEAELVEYARSSQPAAFLAKRFAAKEAAAKAMGTGFRLGLNLRHIEVVNNRHGRPALTFHGRGEALRLELGIGASHLSLTDEREYAIAFVTLMTAS